MNVSGFCTIKMLADCGLAMGDPSDWRGKDHTVIEFGAHDSILVLHQKGGMMGMFKSADIASSFRCDTQGDILIPPFLDTMNQMQYAAMVSTRKGGYNRTLKQMIILASLHRGEFTDSLLWQLQDEETRNFINAIKQHSTRNKTRFERLVTLGVSNIFMGREFNDKVVMMSDADFEEYYHKLKTEMDNVDTKG